MARYFALEWDATEARVVVARSWGSDAIVEHAFSVPLEDGEGDLGSLLKREVADLNVARCDTLVALGRSSTELRLMQLPPAPVDELPDLVRMQALREFANIGEDWPLDFVHVDSVHDETLNVLAATISPPTVKKIQHDCMEFDQTPTRIVLRPFATASLLRRSDQAGSDECRLVVDLLSQEADISVLSDGRVAVMRTVRLPTSDNAEVVCRAVLGEIRRTIPAAQNQLGGRRAEHVTILGSGEIHQQLRDMIVESLSLNVDLFDPFEAVGSEPSARDVRPENPGRYASLLGMICDEAAGDMHAFDFLNPRKRKELPKYDVRKFVLAGALALTVLAAVGYYFVYVGGLKSQIKALREQNDNDKKMVNKHKTFSQDLRKIEAFANNDVTWLDQLLSLAKAIPTSEDVILTQVSGASLASGGALMVDGYIIDPNDIYAMEEALRNEFVSEVDGSRGSFNPNREKYKWQFYERIYVNAENVKLPPKSKSKRKSKRVKKKKAPPTEKAKPLESKKESKPTESKPNDSKAKDSKAKEPKAKEPKAKEPKAKEPKAKEPKAKEPKAKDSKAKSPAGKKPTEKSDTTKKTAAK